MALLGPTSLAVNERAKQAISEHEEIVGAIERRDSQAAEKIARTHIRGSHKARLTLMFNRDIRATASASEALDPKQ